MSSQSRSGEAADLEARANAVQNARGSTVNPKLSDGVYRMSSDIASPSLLYKVEPEYSEEARIAKLSGTVILDAEIGTDGMTHNIHIKRGIGVGLDEKAMEAGRTWKFEPASLRGEPVAIRINVEVAFRLY